MFLCAWLPPAVYLSLLLPSIIFLLPLSCYSASVFPPFSYCFTRCHVRFHEVVTCCTQKYLMCNKSRWKLLCNVNGSPIADFLALCCSHLIFNTLGYLMIGPFSYLILIILPCVTLHGLLLSSLPQSVSVFSMRCWEGIITEPVFESFWFKQPDNGLLIEATRRQTIGFYAT